VRNTLSQIESLDSLAFNILNLQEEFQEKFAILHQLPCLEDLKSYRLQISEYWDSGQNEKI